MTTLVETTRFIFSILFIVTASYLLAAALARDKLPGKFVVSIY